MSHLDVKRSAGKKHNLIIPLPRYFLGTSNNK